MSRVELSVAFVRSAFCPAELKKVDFFDLKQRGFMLEVRRSGGKTYYQRYTDERGRERQFKIGPADVLPLSAARRTALKVQAQALVGDDPQNRRIEMRAIPTLAELVRDRYLPHVKSYKRSWCTDETVLRIHILPFLGSQYIDQIRAEQIAAMVDRMREKKYATGTTNRVVIVLRHIFNLARKWRVPGIKDNPTTGINLAPDVNRERFLSLEEAKRLVASIEGDENQVAANAIMLLLLTGARRNEITQAKWEHIDWSNRTLLVRNPENRGASRSMVPPSRCSVKSKPTATAPISSPRRSRSGHRLRFISPGSGFVCARVFPICVCTT